jgi:hypothetical protein
MTNKDSLAIILKDIKELTDYVAKGNETLNNNLKDRKPPIKLSSWQLIKKLFNFRGSRNVL